MGCDMGVSFVELKYEVVLDRRFSLRGRLAQQIKEKANKHRIGLSVHAPYDDGVSLGDPDEQIQLNTREQMRRSLQFASEIGARYLTVHGGFFEIDHQPLVAQTMGQPNRVTVKQLVSEGQYNALKARTINELRWLIAEGSQYGVKIALENFHDFSTFKVRFPITPQDFQECREALGDAFFITYDSGHGHSTGIHIVDFVRALGIENIIGTHLHDNNQLGDQHLPIFKGTIDFKSFFEHYLTEEWQFPLNIETKNYVDLIKSYETLKNLDWQSWEGVKQC